MGRICRLTLPWTEFSSWQPVLPLCRVLRESSILVSGRIHLSWDERGNQTRYEDEILVFDRQ